VGWSVEFHFRDFAEGKMLCTFSDGRDDLGWWLVVRWVSGGFLRWAFCLDANVGWFFSVTLSGFSLGSEQGERQMLGSDSQGLLDAKYRENAKVGQRTLDDMDYKGVNSEVTLSGAFVK
jgi:hypothetical protein